MAKPPTGAPKESRKRGRGADPEQTKDQLINAAISSLVEEGFSGTTARSIAARAGCNQAAIYYHFGGIEELFITAMKESSKKRLERYRAALHDDQTLLEVIETVDRLYVDDRASDHLALLAELVGGVTANPGLREGIVSATEPWTKFVEGRIRAASKQVEFGGLVPVEDLADLIFSMIVGVELRNRLDGREDRAERLFRLAKLAAQMVPSSPSA